MNTPRRTIERRTLLRHRGRQLVLIIPPNCDFISLRQKGCRAVYDVSLGAVYDMAVRQYVAAQRREKLKLKKR